MKKIIIWSFLALIVGIALGNGTINKYKNAKVENVISYDNEVYAIYYGTFSSLSEVNSLEKYIYKKEGGKYYVYLAITKTRKNALKLKKIYSDIKGISIIKITINNDEFIQNLNEYEKLLNETENEGSLMVIENQILELYRDLIVNE